MNSSGAWANTGTTSITGLDKVDLWVGGLAEITTPFGGLLGTTFNYVFENQLTDLQNGDRLYYLARTPGHEPADPARGQLVRRVDDAQHQCEHPQGGCVRDRGLQVPAGQAGRHAGGFRRQSATRSPTMPLRNAKRICVLIRQPNGTIQYRQFNAVDPSGINAQAVYNGTTGVDRVRGGNDNDTFWGGSRQRRHRGWLPALTSRSAATVTTSSPTSPATTCPRAVPATTPSTQVLAWTSSWPATARTSPTVEPTPTRPSVAPATTSSTSARAWTPHSATAAMTGKKAATSPTC